MNIEGLAAAIRAVESNGNYTAMGAMTKYGRATGAYQFLDSTWGGYGGYKSAASAPAEVQDRKAIQTMTAMDAEFRRRNPNLGDADVARLVAIAWHAGMGTALHAMVTGHAGTRDAFISTDDYATRVLAKLGKVPSLKTSAVAKGQYNPDAPPAPQVEPPEEIKAGLAQSLLNIFGEGGPLNAPPAAAAGPATDFIKQPQDEVA